MTDITCRLTTKNRDQLRNPMLSNRVWATFLHDWPHFLGICCHLWAVINIFSKFEVFNSTRQKGNAKVEIHVVWGQLGFTHGHQQCHHSIEHAQLPPVAFQLVLACVCWKKSCYSGIVQCVCTFSSATYALVMVVEFWHVGNRFLVIFSLLYLSIVTTMFRCWPDFGVVVEHILCR